MAALYITSLQAGGGKTMLCAGLGRRLKDDGKKVGFFKPMVADMKSPQDGDADARFIKHTLALAESIESLCPVISGNLATKIKQAYAKVSKGKDVVIVEGVWRQGPGGKPVETSYEVVKALGARVLVIETYSVQGWKPVEVKEAGKRFFYLYVTPPERTPDYDPEPSNTATEYDWWYFP